MKVTGIHHVSIVVSDMERAASWYRDALGLTEVPRPSNFVTPVRWFAMGNEQVHLIPMDERDTQSPRHFAIHVDDCAAAKAELAARGVSIRETVPVAGAERFFIQDPDGNNIEVLQWFRAWDEKSEAELGVPENGSAVMMSEEWREKRRLDELPGPRG